MDPADKTKALKAVFAVIMFWIPGISMMRTTVAVALMRYNDAKIWKMTLWGVIVLQWLIPIGSITVLFGGCRPLRAFWEPVSSVKCWDRHSQLSYSWFSAGMLSLCTSKKENIKQ